MNHEIIVIIMLALLIIYETTLGIVYLIYIDNPNETKQKVFMVCPLIIFFFTIVYLTITQDNDININKYNESITNLSEARKYVIENNYNSLASEAYLKPYIKDSIEYAKKLKEYIED